MAMKTPDNDKWLDAALKNSLGSEDVLTDFVQWKQHHPEAVETLNSQTSGQADAWSPLTIRRIIMKSSVTKLSAAALIVGALILSIHLWDTSTPVAYAFAQTVEAMQGKRSFHIQTYFQRRPKDEFWAEFDEEGNLLRFRQEEAGGSPEPIVTLWEDGIMNRYYPNCGVREMTLVDNTGGGLEGLEEFDPATIVQGIHALVADGDAIMDIQPSRRNADRMTIHVTHTDGRPLQRTLVVDPDTKRVIRVDDYWDWGNEGGPGHRGIEVLEYNQTINPGLFQPDFPKGTILLDQVTQEVGMAKGDMPLEAFVVELVRAALDAWAQGDFTQAGKLCGGAPANLLTERFGHMRPVGSISITKAERIHPWLSEFWVWCQYEVERQGKREVISPRVGVRGENGRPGRWYVSLIYMK